MPHRLVQRPDDNEATVSERLRVYDEKTRPLIDFYRARGLLRVIDAEGDLDAVTRRLAQALGVPALRAAARPKRATPRKAGRAAAKRKRPAARKKRVVRTKMTRRRASARKAAPRRPKSPRKKSAKRSRTRRA